MISRAGSLIDFLKLKASGLLAHAERKAVPGGVELSVTFEVDDPGVGHLRQHGDDAVDTANQP